MKTLLPATVLPAPDVVKEVVNGDFLALEVLSETHSDYDVLEVMLYPDLTARAGQRFCGYEMPISYADVTDAIATFIQPVRRELLAIGDPIQVTFDTGRVLQGDTQRVSKWHTDASMGPRGLGVMVSDTLPTEFAHGTLHRGSRRDYKNTNPLLVLPESDGKINRVVAQLIEENKLTTSAPESFQVAKFTAHHVHRSPKNMQEELLPRRFLRVRTLNEPRR